MSTYETKVHLVKKVNAMRRCQASRIGAAFRLNGWMRNVWQQDEDDRTVKVDCVFSELQIYFVNGGINVEIGTD